MNDDYEVIIAGAGPSGSILASELAGRGIRVLVLEKDKLPRYKCCAGGVTYRAAKLLNNTMDGSIYNTVNNVTVRYGNDNYSGYSTKDLIYTFRREEFDYELIKMAESTGATVLQGQKVSYIAVNSQINIFPDFICIRLDKPGIIGPAFFLF